MIDKKPFRVTNEQVAQVLNATLIADISPEYLKKYAADLLDARELIDKQESLIKELRGAINNAYKFDGSEKAISFIIAEYENILEKTKDYA